MYCPVNNETYPLGASVSVKDGGSTEGTHLLPFIFYLNSGHAQHIHGAFGPGLELDNRQNNTVDTARARCSWASFFSCVMSRFAVKWRMYG